MEKYRKHDQYYIDMYDRATIQELKILEVEEQKHWATIPEEVGVAGALDEKREIG